MKQMASRENFSDGAFGRKGTIMENTERINGIPTRILGRTGVRVTVIGVGGYHIGKDRDPQLAIYIIH